MFAGELCYSEKGKPQKRLCPIIVFLLRISQPSLLAVVAAVFVRRGA